MSDRDIPPGRGPWPGAVLGEVLGWVAAGALVLAAHGGAVWWLSQRAEAGLPAVWELELAPALGTAPDALDAAPPDPVLQAGPEVPPPPEPGAAPAPPPPAEAPPGSPGPAPLAPPPEALPPDAMPPARTAPNPPPAPPSGSAAAEAAPAEAPASDDPTAAAERPMAGPESETEVETEAETAPAAPPPAMPRPPPRPKRPPVPADPPAPAPRSAAAPRLAAPEAERSAAPAVARGEAPATAAPAVPAQAEARWAQQVNRQVAAHMRRWRNRLGSPAQLTLSIGIDGSGRLTGVAIAGSTGDAATDAAIAAHAAGLRGLPAPPDGRPRSLRLPITLQRRG